MKKVLVVGLLALAGCATPTVTHVRLAELPLATGTVVYSLPRSIVRVRGALTRKDVAEPKCNDEVLAASLGLSREKSSTAWALSDVDVDTYPATDFEQLYAVNDNSTALMTRKLSFQLTEGLALSHAKAESTSALLDLAKGVLRLGSDIAATALAVSPASALTKVRANDFEAARASLCASSAQALIQLRAARVDLLSHKGGERDEMVAADDRLAALEQSVARTFTGELKLTRVPFECRVDPGTLQFPSGTSAEVPLLAVDTRGGKLVSRGGDCSAAADAWGAAGTEATNVVLQLSAAFVSKPEQRGTAVTSGLAYRIPAQTELVVTFGGDPRARASRPIPQLGIVASLPQSSLSGAIEVDLDPATGGLRKFDAVQTAAVSDVAPAAAMLGDSATAIRKARSSAIQDEVDTLDLEVKRLKKVKELKDERAKAAEVRE